MNLKNSTVDKDYMKMSYEQRAFDTDRLEAPPGHVITGVRMRNIGGHINLEAQVRRARVNSSRLLRVQGGVLEEQDRS